MSYRTPSKVVGRIRDLPYEVKFVLHGGAIKYTSIKKTLHSKPFDAPIGTKSIEYLGFTSYDDLVHFPEINKGSMYQLIRQLPSKLIFDSIEYGSRFMDKTGDGVVLTLFVYYLRSNVASAHPPASK